VADHEKTVEQSERNRRNRKEVHRGNRLTMIPQKCEPAFGGLGVSRCTLHPAGDGSLGDVKTQLAVDARRSPSRVFGYHAPNELAKLLRDMFSTDHSSRSRNHAPVGRRIRLDASAQPYLGSRRSGLASSQTKTDTAKPRTVCRIHLV
jgi:hypothetical protein